MDRYVDLSNVFQVDSCLLIHSSLSHEGPAEKAKLVKAVKIRMFVFDTVSLYYSYVIIQ